MECPVQFDEQNKIWSVPSEEVSDAVNANIGQFVLKHLNELDENKIIEINYDTNETLTVADYKRLSVTCAVNFKNLGVKKGDIVLYFCTLNSYITVSVYACYYLGAIVHPVDVNCTEDDLEYSLSIIDPVVILCDDDVYERVQAATQKRNQKNLKHIISFGSFENVLLKPVENFNSFEISPDFGDPAKVICALLSSSGSTGKPKISMISHSTLLHGSLAWWNPNQQSVVFCSSLFRWISQSAMIVQCVYYGFCRIITKKTPSAETTAKILHKYRVTHLFGLPTLLIDTFEYMKNHQLNVDSLQVALTGGESIPDYLMKIGKEVNPKCKIIKAYGMTEVGRIISSCENVVDNGKGSAGWLTESVSAKIVDNTMNRLGPNQKGQICIKTNMFSGYWHGDRKTSEAFDEDGWLLTGDFGYFDDNKLLYVVDRYKDIITYNGTLVFPNPIERVLENHPAICKAIVVGVPHEKGHQPIAFIKLKPEFHNAEKTVGLKTEIGNYLKTNISDDQFPNGDIYVVDKFPLTYTGKVYREELKKIAVDIIKRSKNE